MKNNTILSYVLAQDLLNRLTEEGKDETPLGQELEKFIEYKHASVDPRKPHRLKVLGKISQRFTQMMDGICLIKMTD